MTKYETVKANESGAMSNAREYAARRDYDMAAFWYHAAQGFRMRAETMTIREAMREAEGHEGHWLQKRLQSLQRFESSLLF